MNKNGGAYAMVIIIGMALFLVMSGAAAVAAYGRRVTARYAQYSGNYDLALSGNERVYFLLLNEITKNRDAIEAAVTHEALRQAAAEQRLLYRNGEFFFEEWYIAQLFRREAEAVVAAYTAHWQRRSQAYELAWEAGVSYAQGGEAIHDAFAATTSILPKATGYGISTVIRKSNGFPAEVEAEINWPAHSPHPEKFSPRGFAWRGEPPEHFSTGLFDGSGAGKDITEIINAHLLGALSLYGEDGLVVANRHDLTVQQGDGDAPSIIINAASGSTTTVYGNVDGYIITLGDVHLNGAQVRGGVFAGGAVMSTEGYNAIVPAPELIFALSSNFLLHVKKDVYDFLRLTRFSETAGPTAEIGRVLHSLRFEETDGAAWGEVSLNNFDVYLPGMVKSKRITK
jgi:hypothetical protein